MEEIARSRDPLLEQVKELVEPRSQRYVDTYHTNESSNHACCRGAFKC